MAEMASLCHYGLSNASHKRDVVFGEDSCRSRKGAQVLAALRNLIIGLIQLKQGRAVRRFQPTFRQCQVGFAVFCLDGNFKQYTRAGVL